MLDDGIRAVDDGLHQLAGLLVDEETLETALQRIVTIAADALPSVVGVTVQLLDIESSVSVVASHERIQRLDRDVVAAGDGPALAAYRSGQPVVLEAARAHRRVAVSFEQAGIARVAAVPLRRADRVLGALVVYGSHDSDPDRLVSGALLLAEQAAIAVLNTRMYSTCREQVRQLQEALDTRVVIEQAKGVLMATERCSPDDAFARLREMSQRENRKLRSVAASVVASVRT